MRWIQGRNELRWTLGQEASLTPPCSNLSYFGTKSTVLKKVLVTLLELFGALTVILLPHSDSAPGELCPPWWAYRRLKTNREENLTKHVGFVYANVKKKIEKLMMRRWRQAEKARLIIDNENKIHFSLWVFDCDFEDRLSILIFLNKYETGSSILNFCEQIWGMERAGLLWSAPGVTCPSYATVCTCFLIFI